MNDKRFTRHTPWGFADHYENVGQGIFVCQTPGHGGIFVPDSFLTNIPEAAQEFAARWSGSRNWYEEDCCAPIVVACIPCYFKPSMVASATEFLRNNYPQFLPYIPTA